MFNYNRLQDEQLHSKYNNNGHPENNTRRCILVAIFVILVICAVSLAFYLLLTIDSRQPEQIGQQQEQHRLVCYFTSDKQSLSLVNVPGDLCTHINIGIANVRNSSLELSTRLEQVLQDDASWYRQNHPQVKLLLWIGGADSGHNFAEMVVDHAHRKQFLVSLRAVLRKYLHLDGIDLDWEFPSAYNKERMHYSQLLREVRVEWARERRPNSLLTMAVPAPEGIAFYGYNIQQINLYVDYVNLMSYDFHFFSKMTPFTGLNAPLYARSNEMGLMGTFNINYTVHWWLKNGLERERLVIGLPTYGHSFTLTDPYNRGISAPSEGYGNCGHMGFVTLSETCACAADRWWPVYEYDNATCSPYLSAFGEWISYEDPTSFICKVNYIKSLKIGGLMVFSLNSDDLSNTCGYLTSQNTANAKPVFPIIQTARDILRIS